MSAAASLSASLASSATSPTGVIDSTQSSMPRTFKSALPLYCPASGLRRPPCLGALLTAAREFGFSPHSVILAMQAASRPSNVSDGFWQICRMAVSKFRLRNIGYGPELDELDEDELELADETDEVDDELSELDDELAELTELELALLLELLELLDDWLLDEAELNDEELGELTDDKLLRLDWLDTDRLDELDELSDDTELELDDDALDVLLVLLTAMSWSWS